MKKTVGIVFGTFAPLHRGHVDLIQRAKKQFDKVIVIVSGYKDDRGDKIGLKLNKRFRYVREAFAGDEVISVTSLDETLIPRYPDGWEPWLKKLQESAGWDDQKFDYTFVVSEDEYKDELEKRGYKVLFGERTLGISATMIRENPDKYWRYISAPFRRHFTKKVLIIGSASNGKTTLATDLGRFYDAPVSLEYAREYQIKYNVKDDELSQTDFHYLLLNQYQQTGNMIDSRENRGLVIADTNSTVTKAYYDYYLKGENPVGDKLFDGMFNHINSKERWDLIIFVKPTGKYVDDGFRDQSMASDNERDKFSEYLDSLRAIFHQDTNVVYLNGDYLENYQKSKAAIDEVYNFDL